MYFHIELYLYVLSFWLEQEDFIVLGLKFIFHVSVCV